MLFALVIVGFILLICAEASALPEDQGIGHPFIFPVYTVQNISTVPALPAELVPGPRNMSEWYIWERENASFNLPIRFHMTVYDWKNLTGPYHWWSISWGQWFETDPPAGMQWLLTWVNLWGEGNGTEIWGFDTQARYGLSVQGVLYHPEPVQFEGRQVRDKNLDDGPILIEEAANHSKLSLIPGYRWGGATNTIDPLGYQEGKPLGLIQLGKSNAWDGWILWAIPKNADLTQAELSVNLHSWGSASWYLVNQSHAVKQPEKTAVVPVIFSNWTRG